MVTMVGTETLPENLIENLLYLEHDAIAAYDSTIERLENPTFKQKISEFRGDHIKHVDELTKMAATLKANAPQQGDVKQLLTTGKIAMASMIGDSAILKAMKTNEEDTVTAYERASRHDGVGSDYRKTFETFAADERRHRAWMEQTSTGA